MSSQPPFYAEDPAVRAAFFDIDGTLTNSSDVWDVLINSPYVSRQRKSRLYATALPQYLLSKIDVVDQAKFRERWVQAMASLLKGWTAEQVDSICEQIVHEALIPTLRTDTIEILRRHKERHPVILVSTMFDGIVTRMADYLEVEAGLGSRVDIEDGRATGKITGPLCAGEGKLDFARRYLQEHHPNIRLLECAAYADSQSDIPLLAGVGYPVAVYPDTPMRHAALDHHWRIFENS